MNRDIINRSIERLKKIQSECDPASMEVEELSEEIEELQSMSTFCFDKIHNYMETVEQEYHAEEVGTVHSLYLQGGWHMAEAIYLATLE
jgi:chromosome segregation ATPase